MYYEEKVIDGILCHRNTPDGEFKQLSHVELTRRLVEAEKLNEKFYANISTYHVGLLNTGAN